MVREKTLKRPRRAEPREDLRFAAQILVSLKLRLSQQELNNGAVVKVRLYKLSRVTPEELKSAFETIASAEQAGKVRLCVAPMEIEINCRDCRHVFRSTEPVPCCPGCRGTNVHTVLDREFCIDSVLPEDTGGQARAEERDA